AGVLVSRQLTMELFHIILIYLACLIILAKIGPQGTENNPISEDNYEKLRKRTVLLVLAYLTITVVMAKCIGNIPYLLFVAVVFETISLDRKSTRLNSSHVSISYAVFCLKKKMQKNHV